MNTGNVKCEVECEILLLLQGFLEAQKAVHCYQQ